MRTAFTTGVDEIITTTGVDEIITTTKFEYARGVIILWTKGDFFDFMSLFVGIKTEVYWMVKLLYSIVCLMESKSCIKNLFLEFWNSSGLVLQA